MVPARAGGAPRTLAFEHSTRASSLTEAGVLNKSTYGNRTYYHADQRCPIYPELTKILTKTVGVVDVARELLQPFSDRISVAFVYGSVASGTAGSGSDIDLLIVGDLGLVELSAPMEAAESRLGRAINPVILSPMEARHKLQNRQHFIESVRQSPKLFLLGEDHELGKALSR